MDKRTCKKCGGNDAKHHKGAYYCIECNIKYRRKYSTTAKAKRKALCATWTHQIRKIGWTPTDWHAVLKRQDGRCAICNDPMMQPHADHNHASGKPRALLCRHCNVGLGFFRDDAERLRSAIAYLEYWNVP